MSSFVDRMKGAAMLDTATYEAIEHDRGATGQALGVVALAALAAGIGAVGIVGVSGLIFGIIGALIGWAVWAALVWVIGTKVLAEPQTRSDWGEVARTTGFAQAPGLLRVFGFIPVIGPLIVIIANIWMIVAMVIGVRQALDYSSTWRAVAVVLIGWVINILVYALLAGLGGGRMMGV